MLTLDHRPRSGFTIVELLIVIVVIAILAAITIVAFNGVQRRAAETAVQSDLRAAATALQLAAVDSGTPQSVTSFPSSVKTSERVSLTLSTPATGSFFCINGAYATQTDVRFSYDSKDGLKSGTCSGAVIANSGIGATAPDPAPVTPLVTDNFNRANSTTTMGTAQTGQSWQVINGTWGILNNRAYSVSAHDNDIVAMSLTNHNVEISTRVYGLDAGQYPGLLARASANASSFYIVEIGDSSGRLEMGKDTPSGQQVSLGSAPDGTYQNGALITLRTRDVSNGVEVTVLVNNVQVMQGIDTGAASTRPSGNYFGLRYGTTVGQGMSFDDVTVTPR